MGNAWFDSWKFVTSLLLIDLLIKMVFASEKF